MAVLGQKHPDGKQAIGMLIWRLFQITRLNDDESVDVEDKIMEGNTDSAAATGDLRLLEKKVRSC